jgi:flagellar protein FlgJ
MMTLAIAPALNAHGLPADSGKPSELGATVKHMMGMLWYNMLSELNKSGFSAESLGTGGDSFQSMMLWNVAQNDFGKYDSSLSKATMAQLGAMSDNSPTDHAAGTGPSPFTMDPVTLAQSFAPAGMTGAIAGMTPMADTGVQTDDSDSSAPVPAAPTGSMLDRATSFARTVWPGVQAAAARLGIPAIGLLAQTALETSWGAAAAGNNLFGIKAADGETGTNRATHEMVDGVMVPQTATFRDYSSSAQSLSGYVDLIGAAYHNVVGQSTVAGFAQALQAGGYATDKNYASKIVSLSQSPMMALVLQTIGQTQAASN